MFSNLPKEELIKTVELEKTKAESFRSFYFKTNQDVEAFSLCDSCGEACDCACPCDCSTVCDCDCSCPSCTW